MKAVMTKRGLTIGVIAFAFFKALSLFSVLTSLALKINSAVMPKWNLAKYAANVGIRSR